MSWPLRPLRERSRVVREAVQLESGEREPERLVAESVRDWRCGSVRRWLETVVRFVVSGREVRSMEVTWDWVQVIPEKEHGCLVGSHVGRRDGFGREVLKLMSCCSSAEEEEEEDWRRKRKVREEDKRKSE